MPITTTPKIWMNGKLVDWADAQVHVLTHTLHYGTGVFEGIRAYETKNGPAVFRLTEHIQRLFNSAKILMMDIPYTVEEIVEACKETVRSTGLPGCYVSSSERSIQAVFSCTCMRCVSKSAVGSSPALSTVGKIVRAVRTTAS